MKFPREEELQEIIEIMEKTEPSRSLPPNASTVEKIKYKLCEKFVRYFLKNEISQAELARQINIDPSRINEIVKYRIDLFTIDKLINLAEKLDLDIKIKVA